MTMFRYCENCTKPVKAELHHDVKGPRTQFVEKPMALCFDCPDILRADGHEVSEGRDTPLKK